MNESLRVATQEIKNADKNLLLAVEKHDTLNKVYDTRGNFPTMDLSKNVELFAHAWRDYLKLFQQDVDSVHKSLETCIKNFERTEVEIQGDFKREMS